MSFFNIYVAWLRFAMRFVTAFAFFVAVISGPSVAADQHIMIGPIELRATVTGMSSTGGYVTIANHGTQDVTLIGVSAEFATKSEIHTMRMVDGVMKMRRLDEGILVPAGGHAVLAPGQNHLMFMGLSGALAAGTIHKVTLIFDNGHKAVVMAHVKRPSDIGTSHHGHDQSSDAHSGAMKIDGGN